jgi:glycosyltransferase involved in cell wall biosynthesis
MNTSSLPKILILSNTRGFGGSETNLETIFPYLSRQATVRVVVENAVHHRNLVRLRREPDQITKTPTGSSPLHLAIQFFFVLWAYLSFRPDYVIANNHKAAFLLAAVLKIPVKLHSASAVIIQDFDYYYLPFILKNLKDALYLAPTPAVFSDSRYESWGLTRERYKLVIFPCPTQVPEQELERSGTEPFIACAARITPWKGIDYLVRAFAITKKEAPAAHLRIFGAAVDQTYHKQLLDLVTELGLGSSVYFESFTSNMRQVYADAEFFVVPSIGIKPGPESFCRIITEAWASRKPSVAFAVGGPCYLIDDGVDGYLVEQKNIDALAAAMTRLWHDPDLRQSMGRLGYAKVRSAYDPEQSVTTLLNYLSGKTNRVNERALAPL